MDFDPEITRAVPYTRLVEHHAATHPDEKYALLAPTDNSYSEPPSERAISWSQLNDATIRVAHLLNPLDSTGTPERPRRVIAILAVTDTVIYQTLHLAIVRSGNIPFPISPRNSAEAIAHLLKATDCHDVVINGGPAILSLLHAARALIPNPESFPLEYIPLPSAAAFFPHLFKGSSQSPPPHYPLPADPDDQEAIRLWIHSSGTTSLPKAIPATEQYVRFLINAPVIRDQSVHKLHAFMAAPPFHILGMILQLWVPIANGVTILLWDLAPENTPPPVTTPENTIQAITKFECDATCVVPAFLVQWARNKESVQALAKLGRVITGSGPMPDEVGEYLVESGVKLTTAYGGTEFSVPCALDYNHLRTPREWAWTEFAPEFPVRMNPQGDGTFELQLLAKDYFRPMVINTETPDGPGYNTKDLFVPHPHKHGLWKIVGRVDDQVTLATGEKINPNRIETAVLDSPLVMSAVVIGRGRNQAGLLIETVPGHQVPPGDDKALAAFRNSIWPIVEAINGQSPTFARIFKETIIPSNPDKPFPRTPKGSVPSKKAEQLYTDEIEAMYSAIDEAKGSVTATLPESESQYALEMWLTQILEELMQSQVDPEKDLFDQGADSLTATFLRLRIASALRESSEAPTSERARSVDPNIVFTHPTIVSLARHLHTLLNPNSYSSTTDPNGSSATTQTADSHVREMTALVNKYATGFASSSSTIPITPSARATKETVLITGTTGSLGSYLLAQAIQDKNVQFIWAINRAEKSGQSLPMRQHSSFEEKGLDTNLLHHEKLRLVEGNLSEPLLGLTEGLYRAIVNTTTVIIHNAWRLDFNLSLRSFESHIKGTRNLVDLSLESPQGASSILFVFISSIATLANSPSHGRAFPELPIDDPSISVGTGYGESKYVAEKILESAARETGLLTTSIRVGQLSGGSNGFWSATDWLPNLLQSSVQLGCFPNAQRLVSWVPLHKAATVVLDASLMRERRELHQTERPPQVLHLSHPRPTTWSEMMGSAAKALADDAGITLPIVPWSVWLAKLEVAAQSSDPQTIQRVPGIKLLSFYRSLNMDGVSSKSSKSLQEAGTTALETKRMESLSSTLKYLSPLARSEPSRWIEYWRSKGLFDHPAHHQQPGLLSLGLKSLPGGNLLLYIYSNYILYFVPSMFRGSSI
ncbi:acetyl-CoA synthetase-like protein [Clavulina sp. PMI_390]|nr:acetyl-CoA synthetase-like protein [Clavulina sp. PMI_390]